MRPDVARAQLRHDPHGGRRRFALIGVITPLGSLAIVGSRPWSSHGGLIPRAGRGGAFAQWSPGAVASCCTHAPPPPKRGWHPWLDVASASRGGSRAGDQQGVGAAAAPAGFGIEARTPTVDAEVVSDTGSRPARLLFSPEVQTFVRLCTKLRDVRVEGDISLLQSVILDINLAVQKVLDGQADVPAEFRDDVEDLRKRLEPITDDGTSFNSWPAVINNVGNSRLARRLPEAIDGLLPWDVIYSPALVDRTGVRQEELKAALKSLVSAGLDEVSDWTVDEISEAFDLVERNEAFSGVFKACVRVAVADYMASSLAVLAGVALVALVVLCALGAVGSAFFGAH